MADYSAPPGFEWQCPPAAVSESHKLGWLNEATEDGAAWVKTQRGFSDFTKALDTIAGRDRMVTSAAYKSHLSTNRLKRNIREVIGTLAKLRPMWGYFTNNSAWEANATMMNKVCKAWYLERMADRSIKEALAWAAATGRGWCVPVYSRPFGGTGADIYLKTYGSPSVLPVQLPGDGNWQEAYAITILDETPIYKAHGQFPTFQHRLRPTSSRYWYGSDNIHRAASGNVLQRIFGQFKRDRAKNELAETLIPIRRTYVVDLSINTTEKPIPMGEPGSTWYYEVPPLNSDIPVGIDPRTGQMTTRKATINDARLYPRRRLLISTPDVVLYDGPAFDWHGMFPGVSFALDEWPWEPLGFSLVHDGFEINEAIKEIDRGMMDKIRAQLRPSMAYDTGVVAMNEARAFDPMQPDARIGFDGQASDKPPFQQILDPQTLAIDPIMLQVREVYQQGLDSQMAINDVMALAKARAAGSMDDLEKIMEANGPIVEDMSRSMEPPMRDLGVMIKYDILQYYSTARVMQVVGADGMAPEVFDYDPTSLVPSHVPGEDPDKGDSKLSAMERAKIFADNMKFYILPNSLHELTQMAMKLGLIQLKKSGVMIDSQTIAEAWQVPSYGTIEGNTVIERYQREQEMQLEMMARGKAMADALGLTPPAPPPGSAKPGGGAPEGRPPSGQQAPQLASKDGGTRSTISESGK